MKRCCLVVAATGALACSAPRERAETRTPSATSTPALMVGPVFGTWRVVGHRIPGVSAMTSAEAEAWTGRTIELSPQSAATGADACATPTYETGSAPLDSLLATDYRTAAGALGLAAGGTIEVTRVSCNGTAWPAPGGVLLHVGPNRAFTMWDGVFFELERRGTAADAAAWVLDASRFGSYQVGMSLADLNARLGEHLSPAYQVNSTCDQIDPAGFPEGVIVMVENDTVVRFDVENPAVRTSVGAGVGDPEADVLRRYGRTISVGPHKYTGPEGHYLTVSPPGDSLHQVIFETDGRVVTHLRAGRLPSVAYVEGCA
jgi:hypothetical protein